MHSTRGSVKPETWPEVTQTLGFMRIAESRPTMSSRWWTKVRHQWISRIWLENRATKRNGFYYNIAAKRLCFWIKWKALIADRFSLCSRPSHAGRNWILRDLAMATN